MATIIKSPAKYIQGKGELKNIFKHIKKLGSRIFLLASENSYKRVGEIIEESMKDIEGAAVTFSPFGGECSKDEINKAVEACRKSECDIVIGAGGGKTIDTAKAVADNLDIPVVIVPTIASNDAPCSGIAVIYNDEGVVIKALFTKKNPDLVLVDSEILANAPIRMLVAGMGDALATYFEARAVKNSGSRTMARGQSTNTAYAMAELCYKTLIKDGVQAKKDNEQRIVSEALENVLEANIYLSGVGFESGGLAAAHAINDGFGHLPEAHGAYHGEKVAFGTIVQLVLEDAAELNEVIDFCISVGLPVTLEQLGVTDISMENIKKVADAACVKTQSTKNMPFHVDAEKVCAAILKADELGKSKL
ncbi:glycerol dehydrogenase [Clostridium ganghwense]|uniref:Glycerol dehydrogenase n=1 Tax=Clostridium ganghwense TaxID=312089 RepID=A0ABT4CJZ7_9CLOT|nr:glycerol dehydrogenase [Clostridium ganghwense]MCY6369367.1 glycerol dehydrogenase [Clostridium ganghwense]